MAAAVPLTLYVDAGFFSPYAMSAFVALTEKQLPFDVRQVDIDCGEQHMQPYLKRAMTGRVPALVHGDFQLTESSAITEYLEDVFPAPQHAAVYPRDAHERALARQVQAWLRSDLAALREERTTACVFRGPCATPLSHAALAASAKLVRVALALLPDGRAQLFDQWCLADTDLALMLKRLAHDGDALPDSLRAYAATQWQRPSVQQWVQANAGSHA